MLAIERRNKIQSILLQNKSVLVFDLSKQFNVSEETIRRDLENLEKDGIAKKTYGGAVLLDSLSADLPNTVRKRSNVDKKLKIAEIASSIISDGETIILDASTTAYYIAKSIKTKKKLTIVTNSIEVLLELSEVPGFKLTATGGMLKESGLSFSGPQAERTLRAYHVSKAFISCKGIDINNGITDSLETEAEIKKVMISCSTQRILAVDSSKFDLTSFSKISDFSDIDMVISNYHPDNKWLDFFSKHGITFKNGI